MIASFLFLNSAPRSSINVTSIPGSPSLPPSSPTIFRLASKKRSRNALHNDSSAAVVLAGRG